jgi:hypothetical protein
MDVWPELPYAAWKDTRDTLHMWTQVVGKVRLALTPAINHWWNVPLYVSARGLTTTSMPYGERWVDMEFDFVDHILRIRVSDGEERRVELEPRSVADFYAETMAVLHAAGIDVNVWSTPVEVPDPIPFEQNHGHRSYDRDFVQRFWRILAQTEKVFTTFRGGFLGKCSPVHFFWGSFDLAVTRFSGRPAPPRPDADVITREAYSHEVSSVGWWPGDTRLEAPSFYSYASPEPGGFRTAHVRPDAAYYNQPLGGFYLPYDAVREAADPAAALLTFCEDTYAAAAGLGGWDRASLERPADGQR